FSVKMQATDWGLRHGQKQNNATEQNGAPRVEEEYDRVIARYYREWVPSQVTKWDEHRRPVLGYLIAHSPSRAEISKAMEPRWKRDERDFASYEPRYAKNRVNQSQCDVPRSRDGPRNALGQAAVACPAHLNAVPLRESAPSVSLRIASNGVENTSANDHSPPPSKPQLQHPLVGPRVPLPWRRELQRYPQTLQQLVRPDQQRPTASRRPLDPGKRRRLAQRLLQHRIDERVDRQLPQ